MNIEDEIENPHPNSEIRIMLPQEAMENWNSECWYDWIVCSVEAFTTAQDRRDKLRSFWPLIIDADLFQPEDISLIVKKVLSGGAYNRFCDALAKRVVSLNIRSSWRVVTFTIRAGSSIEFDINSIAFNRLITTIIDNINPNKYSEFALSFSALVSRRGDYRLAYELASAGPELFRSSPSSAVIISSVIAKRDHRDFLPMLDDLYTEIFQKEVNSESWAYVVDKIIEYCGPLRALEIAYEDDAAETWKFRDALHLHRLPLDPEIRWSNESSRQAFDIMRRSEVLIPAEILEMILRRRDAESTAMTFDSLIEQTDRNFALSSSDFSTHSDLSVVDFNFDETI